MSPHSETVRIQICKAAPNTKSVAETTQSSLQREIFLNHKILCW